MNRIRVGLNLLFLVPGETGGREVYARELISAIVGDFPGIELIAFINRETSAAENGFSNGLIESVTLPVNSRSRREWVWGEQVLLPRMARRSGCEVLHSLAGTGPFFTGLPTVVTVHDVLFMTAPGSGSRFRNKVASLLVSGAAKRSDAVVAISDFAGRELTDRLHLQPQKVRVIHNGVGADTGAVPVPGTVLRDRYRLGSRHVALSASTKRQHKNLARLIEAVGSLPRSSRPLLVLPGPSTPYEEELKSLARDTGIEDDVRFLGWVDDSELEGLYAISSLVVYPTLQEGFGMPVLEGMRRGVPVACSDIPVLREVAGDAALFFDPEETGSIAEAMSLLLSNPGLRSQLIGAGEKRAAAFSWSAAAAQLTELYRELAARSG